MNDPLVTKADILAHKVYKIAKDFPKSEQFGLTSQIQRASLSVVLNLIEGFARNSPKEYVRFLWISYGSLKETKYLLHFSMKESYLKKKTYDETIKIAEEIGKMLWGKISHLKNKE